MKTKKAYLLSITCRGNLRNAKDFINTLGLAGYVLAMSFNGEYSTNLVFRVDTWDEYVFVCDALRQEVKLTREYFE